MHNERFAMAHELVASLRSRARRVVELHYFEGFTAREVAERAGLTPANVGIGLMRARQSMAAHAMATGIFA